MFEGGDADPYDVLGVARDATAGEIRHAYRRLARQHHPDLNPHPDGPGRFARLADAYEVLRDPAQRARYDRLHLPVSGSPSPLRSSRRQPTWQQIPPDRIRCGILELSPEEAALVVHHQLRLRDAHGHAIVLPAGTSHGDQFAVLHHGQPAVLTVMIRNDT